MSLNRLRLPLLLLFVAALRLCHIHLLWSDEDYHLTAALQILHGRIPYKDFWYDKPPLAAVYYILIGALPGWPLRLLDVAYVLAACWLAYCLATAWWSEREGRAAALLLAFFTTFYLPAAVIPFAVDALLLVPHLAAILLAQQRRSSLPPSVPSGLLPNGRYSPPDWLRLWPWPPASVGRPGHCRRFICKSGSGDCCMRPVPACRTPPL
jgi:hypothetical protein